MEDPCLVLLCRRIKFDDFSVEEMGELILSANTGLYAEFLKRVMSLPDDREFLKNHQYIERIKMAQKQVKNSCGQMEDILNFRKHNIELREYERALHGPNK